MELVPESYSFFKLRYTFGTDTPDTIQDKIQQIYKSICTDSPHFVTSGIENLNKFGDETHRHIHMHFAFESNEQTVRKRVQRCLAKLDPLRKGVTLYSFKCEKTVLDECRFFRYAWKQGGRYTLVEVLPPCLSGLESELQERIAIEEQSTQWTANRACRDKLAKKNTREMLHMHLDNIVKGYTDNDKQFDWDDERILSTITTFYVNNNKLPNKTSCLGILVVFKLKHGLITHSELSSDWLNN